MNPTVNKSDFEDLTTNLRDLAYSYLEKYSPSKQQLKIYLLKKYLTKIKGTKSKKEVTSIIDEIISNLEKNRILNDETLEVLIKQSLVQAESGADILGPSDMMDGRVKLIRENLEKNNFKNTLILSYSAKFSSGFYGPFRAAIGSSGNLKGDKKSYQLNYLNSNEALKDVALDLKEGADMVMVKPGMPYLDLCRQISDTFKVPTFAYQVSGEYAMLAQGIENGIFDKKNILIETISCFKRAGCNGILTYYAYEIAKLLTNKDF